MKKIFYYSIGMWMLIVTPIVKGQNTPEPTVPNEGTTTLAWPNSPIGDILSVYEQLTGKQLIRDANLTGPNLNIVVPHPIPISEAVRLLESVMLLNGYAVVPLDEKTVKVMSYASKNPRSEGIPLYARVEDLPQIETVVSFFMPLQYLQPEEVLPIFQQQIVPHPYGSFVPVKSAQAVVITESTTVIRQLVQLRELVDVPPATVTSEFVELHRADATVVAEIINRLLEARKAAVAGGTPGATPPPVEIAAGDQAAAQAAQSAAGGGGAKEAALGSGEVKLIVDPRSNRILVITRPVNLPYIKYLIAEFDREVKLPLPTEIPLRYIKVADLVPTIRSLLTEEQGSGAAAATPTATGTTPPAGTPPTANEEIGEGATRTGSSAFTTGDRLSDPGGDIAPQAISIGKTRIITDQRANSLIVFGPPEHVQKIKMLVESLDREPLQVYLASVIGQLQLGDGFDFGVDLLQKFTPIGADGTGSKWASSSLGTPGASPIGPSIDPRSLTKIGNFLPLRGLTLYGTIGDTLNAYVRALKSSNRFKVISRPVVYGMNNRKAVITSGQEVPVPTATQGTVVNNNQNINNNLALNSQIEFKEVALKLEVTPLINSFKEVTLRIAQRNDSLGETKNISGIEVPTVNKQEIITTVTVTNKGIVVLGGLINEDVRRNRTGIPILSDIPLLGYLFRQTRREQNRTELIILIQPTVIASKEDLAEATRTEEDRMAISEPAVKMAEPAVRKRKQPTFNELGFKEK